MKDKLIEKNHSFKYVIIGNERITREAVETISDMERSRITEGVEELEGMNISGEIVPCEFVIWIKKEDVLKIIGGKG